MANILIQIQSVFKTPTSDLMYIINNEHGDEMRLPESDHYYVFTLGTLNHMLYLPITLSVYDLHQEDLVTEKNPNHPDLS